jgi:ribonuclease R
MIALEDRVLALFSRADSQPRSLVEIAEELALPPEGDRELRAVLRELTRAGRIERTNDKRFKKPSVAGTIVGTFRRAARGHGFVRPKSSTGRHTDIFVPVEAGLDASTGDEVAVAVVRKGFRPGQGPAGRIVRVLARASGQFVGTYYEEEDSGYVKVDGTTFHDPIWVGDPGAKGARPGDKVVLEIVRYPTPLAEGEGVLTEVLGPRGHPGIDTISVIRSFNLPVDWSPEAVDEAREQVHAFDGQDLHGRIDLRDRLTVTIDPATAHDFDDAISLERDEQGYWQLAVHIADVAHFVRAGSALDRDARKRGTSVYLPGKVIPMLPEAISNSLASLQQGHTRLTVSALLEFDPNGVRTHTEFHRSAIRVDHRFTYEQAYDAMMHPKKVILGVGAELRACLTRMLELAMILRRRRRERGSLELSMPEVEIELDANGRVCGAHLAQDDESHQTIEEFMLAANEAVAEFLTERGAGFLRRVHPPPEARKLAQFGEFVTGLGFTIENPESRFELQKVLAESADKPERHAIHFGLLRSLKQAIYTPEPEEHYALASQNYCHFTSPIRRYPDLQVHRQLISILNRHKPKVKLDELAVLGEHCTKTERRFEAAERDLKRVKLLTYLEERIGARYDAIVIGVEEFGLFMQLVELPVEGLVLVTSLADDMYDHDAIHHTLVGRRRGRAYRLGQHHQIRVARVDIDRRELDLVLAADHPDDLPAPRRRAGSRGPRTTISEPPRPASRRKFGGPESRRKGSRRRKS